MQFCISYFLLRQKWKLDYSKHWKHFTFQLNQPSWSCWLFHKACHGQTLPTVWVQTNKKNNIHWPIVHFELIGNFIETIQRYKFKWSHKIPRGNPSVFVIAQMLVYHKLTLTVCPSFPGSLLLLIQT